MKNALGALCLFGAMAASVPASASVVIGGYTFADNAFADTLLSSSGTFTPTGGSFPGVLTDANPNTYAISFDLGAFVELGFIDNTLVNGQGADLVLFDLGAPATFRVTINNVTLDYLSSDTGSDAAGFDLTAAAIDLQAFGLAADALVGSVKIDVSGGNPVPSLSLVGARNSGSVTAVPEPASLALAGLGLAGIAASRRRSK